MNFHYIWEEKGKDARDDSETNCQTPERPVGSCKENNSDEDHEAYAKAWNKAKEKVAKFVESTESVA